MHNKALDLLREWVLYSFIYDALLIVPYRLSEREDNTRDKLAPSIAYLQKLGPEHMDQIFEGSRWVFDQDEDIALEVKPYSTTHRCSLTCLVDIHFGGCRTSPSFCGRFLGPFEQVYLCEIY